MPDIVAGTDPSPYADCHLCPRDCGVDRTTSARGVCRVPADLVVARAMLHRWEEPPISGTRGSGAVFFSGCPLHCCMCQNAEISDGTVGRTIDTERLAQIFLELVAQGAHNINLVTGTQYAPSIVRALGLARDEGLAVPIVWNTSGYETVETIRLLEGSVDIYLTDFKYAAGELATRYSHAPDYPEVALAALEEMVAQVGPYTLQREPDDPDETAGTDENLLERGVVVRQLLLPGALADAMQVTDLVFGRFGNRVCYSLMNQYTPMSGCATFPELAGPVDDDDYDAFVDHALDLGVERSFMQEGGTVAESFIPAFDCQGV